MTSKWFSLLLVSISAVNFRLGCTALKSSNMFWMFVWLESKINLFTPNVNYSGRTAPLTSKVAFYIFIQQV